MTPDFLLESNNTLPRLETAIGTRQPHMHNIHTIEALESLYGQPSQRSIEKVANQITPLYRQWIEASRFLILSTACEARTDASPRGDKDQLVLCPDNKTIWLPDWRGNNRVDSLRNIVLNGQVSLLFMINSCDNVVRVIGQATITTDPDILKQFERDNKQPISVVATEVREVYFQCAKALMRSGLWLADNSAPDVPTAGQFLKEQDREFDADKYDGGYAPYAKSRLW